MTARAALPRSLLFTNCALVLLWLALAIGISSFALHLSIAAVRGGDIGLVEAAGGFTRMADSMAERGASSSDIVTAIIAGARARDFDVTTQPLPERRQMGPGIKVPMGAPPPPFSIMMPAGSMFGSPDPFATPSVALHVDGVMLLITLSNTPWLPVAQAYAVAMAILLVLAIVVTWLVNARGLRRALAPMTTVESALRRLASGEYTRLEMIGDEPGERGVIDAYNAAADELATSIRLRAEAESNTRQFVADAGHELRTPLTVIMGFVDVLRQGAIAEQALAQRILDSVAAEGERMRRLIARLLMLARLDAVAPERQESVDLSHVVSDTVESFRPLAGTTTLGVKLESDVIVIGSAPDIREIVGILVDNALKYAPGSNVTVTTSHEGRYGTISVVDDGPGMAPDLRVRAFDRFSRGDERGSVPGSGLGLAIVKRIAVRAGGEVDLESTLGKGTQVRVRLPLADAR
jgi:signal transduction histidine kinase